MVSDNSPQTLYRYGQLRLRRFFMSVLLASCSLTTPTTSQATDLSEKLKAVYIANIAKFVTWPSSTKDITLCLHSNANIHIQASSLNNLVIGNGRTLKVSYNPADYTRCNLMYWDEHSIRYRDRPSHSHVLEISDVPNALNLGMDIELMVVDNKMHFSIAYAQVETSEFAISSKLLRLSKNRSNP